MRIAAVNLLGSQGNKALPHLIVALKDADTNVRFAAVNAIQRIPGDIKEALPALVPLLKEGQPFQRRNVILALGRMGEPACRICSIVCRTTTTSCARRPSSPCKTLERTPRKRCRS